MFRDFNFLDGVSYFYKKTIIINEPFITFASRFAYDFGTVVLLSSGNSDCGRYNILGYKPWLHFHGKHRKMSITVDGKTIEFDADPFDTLKYLLKICDISDVEFDVPIASGLMGYLAYDLKDHLEKLPLTTIDDTYLPDICFFAPSIIVIQDVFKNIAHLFVSSSKRGGIGNQESSIESFNKKLKGPPPINGNFSCDDKGCKSNLTHSEYVNAVKKIKQYISEGHVYQVNMSQRFATGFEGDKFAFFKALYEINPAPFFAYINANNHHIVSTSPERLVMQRKNEVETRPIKGTRPRGKTLEVDNLMRDELLNSQKDDAELSMIVDLLRNDLGKVCRSNSISVDEHKMLEAYHNVYHLVSIIKGELDPSRDCIDLIKAIFPGGSITGCPKIRSMEIIDELEVHRRHVYTGSIGYISFHKTMDLSVAIRTATIYNDQVRFSVGGGIVYDSDPEEEFKETIHKGQTFIDVFSNSSAAVFAQAHKYMIWINGLITPLNSASIPISDLGLMYGFGFFETLRVEYGHVQFLEEHIRRFNETWRILFKIPVPDLTWSSIIQQVIEANQLERLSASVKIIATRGNLSNNDLFDGSIIVSAKKYKPRLLSDDVWGLKTAIYPYARQTPLAVHKTLNYLYYHLAGLWAADNGFDEAIILNPDGTISECNSSNIFLIDGKNLVLPESEFVLPGVMIGVVLKQLKKMGYKIINRPLKPNELFNKYSIFITNSLIGILPVVSINNEIIRFESAIAKTISKLF